MSAPSVAIIGAGPGGCAAAIRLAQFGHNVVLLERGFPLKDKPCGDAWLPDALAQFEILGIPANIMTGGDTRAFDRIDLWDATRQIWTIPLDGNTGRIAPRNTIDQVLRDIAACLVDLRYGSKVVDLAPNPDGWSLIVSTVSGIRREIRVPAVILATGAANAFSRRFGISGNPDTGASISVYGRLAGIDAPLFQFAPLGVPGYGWIFPLANDRVNIGVCAAVHTPSNLRTITQRYLDRWQPADAGPFRAGAGPMWSCTGTRWHTSNGLVSCGDAAGLVDPLTGEGIAPAIESGIAAADAIHTFLDGSPEALPAYSDWIAATFNARYALTPSRNIWRYLNLGTNITPSHNPAGQMSESLLLGQSRLPDGRSRAL
ncbi:MAG TPA: NAD(P)/FAD-dependent oxidoreductase [Thermomicrobiales bacterium]|nr:NAD(P)/FAD-dependent oxidoreductase [Thermomicrobiales bacterium]